MAVVRELNENSGAGEVLVRMMQQMQEKATTTGDYVRRYCSNVPPHFLRFDSQSSLNDASEGGTVKAAVDQPVAQPFTPPCAPRPAPVETPSRLPRKRRASESALAQSEDHAWRASPEAGLHRR